MSFKKYFKMLLPYPCWQIFWLEMMKLLDVVSILKELPDDILWLSIFEYLRMYPESN